MSRGGSGSANNIPLGNRPPGAGTTFGKAPLNDGGSLLKPAYLQQQNGSSAFGQPPPPPPAGVKRPNMELIASLNKALGHTPGSNPPPMVGPGPSEVEDIAAAAAAAAKIAAAKAAAAAQADKNDGAPDRKRKRKSRWGGGESDKTFIPGIPTMIPSNLSKEQEEIYLLQLKIEDASRRLRTGDFGIPANPEDRSPSPEPIYSSDGKRMNTREYRKRKELEETRHASIQKLMSMNCEYKPPADYKPPQIKVSDKVMIPQEEHPEINFVGLLIGPRGNTLKSMEKETGAKIIIRGKGSVKEGKVGRKDGQPLPGEDEPLHAYVTATDLDSVNKAVAKIKEVIQQGVEVPEGQNDLRRNQLRELALLNGTLREGDLPRCSNCGADDHKSWQCQDRANVTNNIVCTSCGGVGHPAKDCTGKRPGTGFGDGDGEGKSNIDEEYMSLMAELGEGPAPPPKEAGSSKPWQDSGSRAGAAFRSGGGPPRAIMGSRPPFAPPPPPPPGTGNGKPPPSLMQQNIPPPWDGGDWNQPPPPGAPPPPPGSRQPPPPGQWGGYGGGNYLSAPPPPPPPSTGSGSASSTPSWSWSGGPGPVPPPPPPPSSGDSGPPPGWGGWGSWQGAPPPPPPPGGGAGGRHQLSSLISAPPPPPPS